MDTLEPVPDPVDVAEIDEAPDSLPDLPTDAQAEHQLETELQISMAADNLADIPELGEEVWRSLDAAQRLGVLQNVENTMAGIQNREPVAIQAEPLEPGVFGGFNPNTGGIAINEAHLAGEDVPPVEHLNTIIHEGRHAFQDQAIKDPALVTDPQVMAEWAENNEMYLDPALVGQEIYQSQPLEKDAFDYADRVVNMIIAGQLGPVERQA